MTSNQPATGWINLHDAKPLKDQRVEWIAPSGSQVRGTFAGGLIWFPEGSDVYIYYTPVFWRPLND